MQSEFSILVFNCFYFDIFTPLIFVYWFLNCQNQLSYIEPSDDHSQTMDMFKTFDIILNWNPVDLLNHISEELMTQDWITKKGNESFCALQSIN